MNSGRRGLLTTAAMGLVPIMDVNDMVDALLAQARARGKCPYGHIGAGPEKAEDNFLISPSAGTLQLSGISAMTVLFLAILIGACAIAAAVALIRGLKAFLHDGDQIRQTGQTNEEFGLKQNRMMTQRVLFQGMAIVLIALIGALAGKS